MQFYACDVSDAVQRQALAQQVITKHSQLNVVINNAGITQQHNLTGSLNAKKGAANITLTGSKVVHS